MKLKLVEKEKPIELISKIGKDLAPSGIREFFDIVYSTPDCISLGVGEPDFETPWRISESGIQAILEGCTHYTPNRGLPELCHSVSTYLKDQYSINYNPESEILITMGVSQGLDLALRSIINPGDEIIIFDPCYVSYAANINLIGGKPVSIPLDMKKGFSIDVDLLKKSITDKTKAILLNYPANPTGSTIDPDTLKEISKIAKNNNLIIISDEIYSAIVFDKEHTSIVTIDEMKDRTIYLNGFSKSHAMTGWRLGLIGGPKYLIDIMLKIHQYTALCAPSIAQYAAIEALKKGNKDVEKMKAEYKRRRNFIVNIFNDSGLNCHMPGGAFYVFPDITSTGLSSRNFALKLLEKEKVAVVPGNAFGKAGEGYIRCSYATSMKNLQESMKRIHKFVNQL